MAFVVGIRFKQNGKTYYFDPSGHELETGSWAVVETARGQECGEVVSGPRTVEDAEITTPLKPVLRPATQEELDRMAMNRARTEEVFAIGQERIDAHNLDMKLVDVEFAFDGKLLFYFTSEGRVDFRNLVRDLASIFHTRIELRQIGVRDEARMLGGLGPCGRGICCREFLSNFQPVSIKMAKEQSLSLNPTKISGLCGRLMCCLKYEQDNYEQTRKRAPKQGREVMTPDGIGVVTDINILRETVGVRLTAPDGTFETRSFPIDHVGPSGKALPDEILREAADRKAALSAQAEESKRSSPARSAAREAEPPAQRAPADRERPKPKAAQQADHQKKDEQPKQTRAVKPWKPRGDAKPAPDAPPQKNQDARPQARPAEPGEPPPRRNASQQQRRGGRSQRGGRKPQPPAES